MQHRRPPRLLPSLLRSSKGTLALAVLTGTVSGAGSVALIALTQAALAPNERGPAALAWGFGGLCLLTLATRSASHALLIRLWQRGACQLNTRLSRLILATPLRRLEDLGSHRLLAALTDDVAVIANALLGVPSLCINAAVVASCLAYLAWLSPAVFLAVLAFLVVGVGTYQALVARALGQLGRGRQEQDALLRHFRGLTEGIKQLQLHRGRAEAFLEEVSATAHSLQRHNSRGMTLYAVAGSWGQCLFFVCIGLVLFALPRLTSLGWDVLAGATLTVLYAAAPLEGIVSWLPLLGRARVAVYNLDDLALALHDSEAAKAAGDFPTVLEQLELADVTHSYLGESEDEGFQLGPISLTLRPGELVILAGGNGSGKTTLAKLLTGLYAPDGGEVRVNGVPVTAETRPAYRQLFAAVFADCHLFERLLGLNDGDVDARAGDYLTLLELDHKVRVQGGGFSTVELSQGQRKRLALMVTYLEDRPCYVFDEWAADQDGHFREVFYTRLLPELRARGKCVLAISHDDRYFHVADRVLKLDRGQLQRGEADYATDALCH